MLIASDDARCISLVRSWSTSGRSWCRSSSTRLIRLSIWDRTGNSWLESFEYMCIGYSWCLRSPYLWTCFCLFTHDTRKTRITHLCLNRLATSNTSHMPYVLIVGKRFLFCLAECYSDTLYLMCNSYGISISCTRHLVHAKRLACGSGLYSAWLDWAIRSPSYLLVFQPQEHS